MLLGLHVVPENSVDRGLISLSLPAKEAKDIRIETQSDLLLLSGPANRVREEIGTEFWDLREIDL